MKKLIICIAAAIALAACGPKERTIDFPAVEAATTTSIIIEKVELTDSLTTLHMRERRRQPDDNLQTESIDFECFLIYLHIEKVYKEFPLASVESCCISPEAGSFA